MTRRKKQNSCLVIVTSLNCLHLKEMSILYIEARSDSVCAFDFRRRHAACSLAERAFWECVKKVQYARSFSVSFFTVILSQTQLREKMIVEKKMRIKNPTITVRMSLISFFFKPVLNSLYIIFNRSRLIIDVIVPLIIIIR